MRLYSSSSRFVLEPLNTSNPKQTASGSGLDANSNSAVNEGVLFIDRTSVEPLSMSVKSRPEFNPKDGVQDIYGIVGIIKLLRGLYLIVITGRKCVGKLENSEIWQVTRTKIIPFNSSNKLTPIQEQDEERYLSAIESILACPMYFSYTYDVTHRMQYNVALTQSMKTEPMWKRADKRFFWNYHLQQDFIKQGLDSWVLPVMMGYIQIENCVINNHDFQFSVISRRNVKRAGTRYNVRGIDSEGNVANNVETEQIVCYQQYVASFVETRGSIPVFWQQKANLQYKPKLLISGSENDSLSACRRHFDEQTKLYGSHVVVNLIDHKGSELKLGEAYDSIVKKLNNPLIRYVAFDFHRECRNMRYDKVSILLGQVNKDLDKNGYFFAHKDGNILNNQAGLVRTNCMDNLDRTNLVQSIFAAYVLEQQLLRMGILGPTQSINDHPQFQYIFKNVWANNGDAISLQYSGTGALKSDYTRTGKRTYQGALNDGWNSAVRYYLNNFKDGTRQDAFDLFLGNYEVDSKVPSPYAAGDRNNLYLIVLLIGALMLAVTLFAPSELNTVYKGGVILFWLAAIFVAWKTLLYYGTQLVNNPVLVTNH